MRWKIHSLFLLAAVCLPAQNPAPPARDPNVPEKDSAAPAPMLVNSGEPMKVEFACPEEDLVAAGMACSDSDPCPVYIELSGVSATGKNLSLVGNLHGPVSTLSSILLFSDDSGATWKEPSARLQGAALDQVQLLDSQHAWAAGETQFPLARDPFFLLTTDGGATWRRKLLGEDGSPGALQKFWFDTVDHGELIIDAGRSAEGGRYAFYESHTGGDSWDIRSKTNQLPRLSRAPALDDVDYRLGTDSRSHSYVVEKRNGETWNRLASFLVQVALCGSPPVKPAPEPDPPAPTEPPADAK